MSWTTVLTDPGTFFQERRHDPRLAGPALIVLVIGILGLVSAVPGFYLIYDNAPQAAQVIVLAGLVIGAMVALVVPFAVWLVYALVFYVVSLMFDGRGEFKTLFVLIGWGFLPRILGSTVSIVVAFIALGGVPPPEYAQPAHQLQSPLRSDPLVRGASVFDILITLWSAYIWTHAVATTRDLTLREAAATVGIPVGISVLWTVSRLLGIPLF